MKINSVLKFALHQVAKESFRFLTIDYSFDDYLSAQANVQFVNDEMQDFAETFKQIAVSKGLQDLSLEVIVLPHSPIMFFDQRVGGATMHRMIDLTPIFSYLGGNFDELKANSIFVDFLKQKGIYSFDQKAYIGHLKASK